MGRKKIEIKPIEDERNRHVTFNKRKSGLVKKAMELSILCKSQISLIIFSENHLYEYCSHDPKEVLNKYCHVAHRPHERLNNEDYLKFDGSGTLPKKQKEASNKRTGEEIRKNLENIQTTTKATTKAKKEESPSPQQQQLQHQHQHQHQQPQQQQMQKLPTLQQAQPPQQLPPGVRYMPYPGQGGQSPLPMVMRFMPPYPTRQPPYPNGAMVNANGAMVNERGVRKRPSHLHMSNPNPPQKRKSMNNLTVEIPSNQQQSQDTKPSANGISALLKSVTPTRGGVDSALPFTPDINGANQSFSYEDIMPTPNTTAQTPNWSS